MHSAVVIFGPTQAGKSTLVDFLTVVEVSIPIGDGDGHSVTAEAQLYAETQLGCPLLDTPGINDTLMRFTNQEAGARVALGVAKARPKFLKFIVVDSLANDSMQLNNTLETFTLAFGREVLPSVVVLATKADLRQGAARERRVETMRKAAAKQGIQQLLVWQSEQISQDDQAAQLAKLLQALEKIPGVETKHLKDLNARVEMKAKQLHAEAPMQTKEVVVDEEYQEAYDEQEPYQEPYTDWVEQDEQVTEYVPKTDTVEQTVKVPYLERGNLIGKLFSLGFACKDELVEKKETVKVQVTNYVKEERTKKVRVPQTAHRTAYRTVTKYRTKQRQVTKSVEYRLELEHFYDRALAEITAEMRQALTSPADLALGASASVTSVQSFGSEC